MDEAPAIVMSELNLQSRRAVTLGPALSGTMVSGER